MEKKKVDGEEEGYREVEIIYKGHVRKFQAEIVLPCNGRGVNHGKELSYRVTDMEVNNGKS